MVQYLCDRCGEVMETGHSVRVAIAGNVIEGVDLPTRFDVRHDQIYSFEVCELCKTGLLAYFAKWRPALPNLSGPMR